MVVGNVGQGPGNELAVAVFAVNMGMDILGADMEALCQLRLETAGIQNGTGADDLILGQAGDLMEHISQNIHRVTDDDILGIGSHRNDALGHILDDVYIGLCQVQAGHAGLSGNTAGDNHNVGAHCILIVTGADNRGRMEGSALVNIQCFAFRLLLVDIYQQDLRGNALNHQIVCNRCANAACTNNRNLTHTFKSPFHDVWNFRSSSIDNIISFSSRFVNPFHHRLFRWDI